MGKAYEIDPNHNLATPGIFDGFNAVHGVETDRAMAMDSILEQNSQCDNINVTRLSSPNSSSTIDTTINNITMLSSPSTSSTTDNVTRLSSSSTISTTDNVTRLSSPSTTSSTTDDVTMLSSSKGKGNGKTTSTSTSTSENINNVTSPSRLNRYIFKASNG